MKIEFKETLFRIAGMPRRIKNLEPPPHWRFEIAEHSRQYQLRDFHFKGQATSENNRPGVNRRQKEKSCKRGLPVRATSLSMNKIMPILSF